MQGGRFAIFRPLYDHNFLALPQYGDVQLLEPPEKWVKVLLSRMEWLDTLTTGNDDRLPLERARATYLEMLKAYVSGVVYGKEERSVPPGTHTGKKKLKVSQLNLGTRSSGAEWAYMGYTMVGSKRLDNIRDLLFDVMKNDIKGDYIETGVWRGGASIFARGLMRAYNQSSRRSYVCDSFHGLPPGNASIAKRDKGWDNTPYLEVAAERVAGHFRESGTLDPNVIFAKGFFNDTMKPLRPVINDLAIMRLDGDMYESTVDVLYNLYDRLSVGGFVIMDDWFGFPSKLACEDFFKAHGMSPHIIAIDAASAYWQKKEHIDVQYWRYESKQFRTV
jgi:hypothetical protein